MNDFFDIRKPFDQTTRMHSFAGLSDIIIELLSKEFTDVGFRIKDFGSFGGVQINFRRNDGEFGYMETLTTLVDSVSLINVLNSGDGREVLQSLLREEITEWIKSMEYVRPCDMEANKNEKNNS